MKSKHAPRAIVTAVLCLLMPVGVSATTWYVNPGGTGDFTAIQTAITSALVVTGDVVVVVPATYTEHINLFGKAITLQSVNPLDPDIVGTTIIDGANSGTCVTFDHVEDLRTILTGFTIRNGSRAPYGGGIECAGSSPTISNCIIKDNVASGIGGGICNRNNSSPRVTNCMFTNNGAEGGYGGGIYNAPGCSPAITNCLFLDSWAGVWNGESQPCAGAPIITNCTFAGNYGQGLVNYSNSTVVTNCILWDATAIHNEGTSTIIAWNDIRGGWSGNNISADPCFANVAGGDFRITAGSPCIDAGNNYAVPAGITKDLGGANRFYDDASTVNTGQGSGAIVDIGAYEFHYHSTWYVEPVGSGDFTTIQAALDSPRVTDGDTVIVAPSRYSESVNMPGKAITLQSVNPLDPQIVEGTSIYGDDTQTCVTFNHGEGPGTVLKGFTVESGYGANYGGGIECVASSPTIANCTIRNNWANSAGGGICNRSGSSPKVTNCIFAYNTGEDYGGGIYNAPGCSPSITNCLFLYNGSGVWNGEWLPGAGAPVITNCTFAGNYGQGLVNYSNSTVMSNCILWDQDAIYNEGGSVTFARNDIKGGFGGNNINAAPCFVDVAEGDFRLAAGSPCIDAGNNGAVPSGITTDLGGMSRFYDDLSTVDTGAGSAPIVDMGAYEYNHGVCGDAEHPIPVADLNRDCVVNFTDFALFSGQWLTCTKPECPQ
jgi:hypothetical protein